MLNIEQDGTLTRAYEGTCEQNGFQNGIFGGGTPQDSLPNGASADCFAEIGSNCHMRDKGEREHVHVCLRWLVRCGVAELDGGER